MSSPTPRRSAPIDPILDQLNDPQRKAVLHRDGPLLVLAGPGSGKTRAITRRTAHLVLTGVAPGHVLAITFTNKAAREMRDRIEALNIPPGIWVYTFHALGVRLLREFGPHVRVMSGFSIYDEADQARVVREAIEAAGVNDTRLTPEAALGAISREKNRLMTPVEAAAAADSAEEQTLARIYELYDRLMQDRNALDFDDLLMKVALLLKHHPDVTARLNDRFRYVLVDEYQDTNQAQYVIARALSHHHRNLCVTGDPDQSIYAWRGADIGNILAFEQDYPDAIVIRLEQNYRSTGNILRVADLLISASTKRKPKSLWTANPSGETVQLWSFIDDRSEADRIAAAIAEQHAQGRRYGDFAIFYRVNAVSRGLEESLRRRAIPYRIARGVEFYSRKEIKDALAYLRLLINPADTVALLRIINTPARGIGKTTIERIVSASARSGRSILELLREVESIPAMSAAAARRLRDFVGLIDQMRAESARFGVADAVDRVVELSGLEQALKDDGEGGGDDRLANLAELVTAARQYEEDADDPDGVSLDGFLTRVSLVSDQDQVDPDAGAVMLMTLHTAKGLEFPVVFVAGLEQGMLPHERAIRNDDIEEERRLCFVGITRARERLFLTHADYRLVRGQRTPRTASQFLREMFDAAAMVEHRFAPETQSSSTSAFAAHGENFVPFDDAIDGRPPAQSRLHRALSDDDGSVFSMNDLSAAANGPSGPPLVRPDSPFHDWKAGMLVRHKTYGVGAIVSIRPGPQTRATIRFAGQGERVFVLDLAPIEKLKR